MIKKVLIANRGEIAVRIIRACRDLNISMTAVYSEPDRDSLFANLATDAVCIGPASVKDSYLNIDNIIEAAIKTGCDAVHPGFGFLSENADFARRVTRAGLIFIGPSAEVIEKMGDKNAARDMMRKNGVPVVPGSAGLVEDAEDALKIAEGIGYPVLIKATAGGGGRGMRRVNAPEEMENAFQEASLEARLAFGCGDVYLEKLILNPRHIEVQILADEQGNVVHLGERECSIQRRNQKMIEESPSKAVSPEMRETLGTYAVNAAKACGYVGAGTVEFVYSHDDNKAYFIEMNTRIQVEHPVTEMVTGIDIVKQQIKIASGAKLGFTQSDVTVTGHAIECRICAEDPDNDFAPCPGDVNFVHFPGGYGVRVDSALFSGCSISPYYDSMAAKIIVHGSTRSEALYRMRRALEELMITGVKTNQSFQYMILYNIDFISGHYDTGFIEKNIDKLLQPIEREGLDVF